ncbi:hypothetical protein ACFL4Z_02135 [candidate division KSB1 bacterium]
MSKEEDSSGILESHSLQLMGVFLGVFGIIMVISMVFPEDLEGKLANLITGLVLLGVGLGAFLKGKCKGDKKDT